MATKEEGTERKKERTKEKKKERKKEREKRKYDIQIHFHSATAAAVSCAEETGRRILGVCLDK